ncbi:uncharacterized protein LOC131659432 [Vicia villosa]|uniref:uncharacterized protein LOC131659432 n=1 Tax=Vicia villosa TaxID=3911 RepID=UPI00273CB0DD|nr:uncharacterized protein LOC131659432 [Vicia villosa]
MPSSAAHEQDASNAPINPSEILEVTPLQMVTPFDLVTKRPRTMHAQRTKETARRPRNPNSGQTSQSSVPPSKEELTKEISRSNHLDIVKIVTQILNEENASSKIPGPENPVLPKSNVFEHVSDTGEICVPTNDEMNENMHVSNKKRNDGQTENKEPEKTQTDTVINLDDIFDDDLKAWSKVVPKKRKAISSSENESDSDVAANVNDIHLKKKVSNSKLAASVPEIPIDNISFHYPSSVLRWKFVYHKRLALERELTQNALENDEIMNLIHEDGLMKTVTHLSKCYEILVKEFIVNLHENCGNKETEEYLKVFVRGKCIKFSPTVINKFLERSNQAQPELEVSDNQMCKEITAGQVPTQHKSTISARLGKFIFAIGTKSKVDYGTYIFKQTLKHAGSYSIKGPIAFPSLICGIILKQFPNILTDKDSVCKRASPLIFHHKLFQGTHVHDINKTSAGPSNESTIMSKTSMVAVLRETCKELEARKLALERLISSIETSESAKSADTNVAEQGADDGVSDNEVVKESITEDGTENSVEFSSSESDD